MSIEILMTIMTSFLSLLLVINAYFTRQTLQAITEVRLELARLIVKHDATEERSKRNEIEVLKARDRLHSLEGGQDSIASFIEEYIKRDVNNE